MRFLLLSILLVFAAIAVTPSAVACESGGMVVLVGVQIEQEERDCSESYSDPSTSWSTQSSHSSLRVTDTRTGASVSTSESRDTSEWNHDAGSGAYGQEQSASSFGAAAFLPGAGVMYREEAYSGSHTEPSWTGSYESSQRSLVVFTPAVATAVLVGGWEQTSGSSCVDHTMVYSSVSTLVLSRGIAVLSGGDHC